jgi:hypothetical protein
MSKALTLSVRGVEGERNNSLFKFFRSRQWGFISNLVVRGDTAYVNLVNWEDKFPDIEGEELSLPYKDKTVVIRRLDWAPRKKWNKDQFSCLTSFIEVGR